MTVSQKLQSRKLWLTVATVVYSIFQNDPKYAAVATSVYVFVEGLIDLLGKNNVIVTDDFDEDYDFGEAE